MTSPKKYSTDFVLSKDGTKIGYRQMGEGSGIILLHGGMNASQNLMKLAEFLANEFTLYIPDRRGRGLSGLIGENYGLLKECEDLQALINKTKVQKIFGHSFGAIITLQTALLDSSIKKIALYEPPIPVNGTNPASWVNNYEMAMSEGNIGKAMISIVKGTGDSSFLGILPEFITVPFMNFAIKAEAKEVKGDDVSLKTLIETMHFDPKAVMESKGIIEKCKNMTADVLLLGGQKSQQYLKIALDALSATLKQSKLVEFSGIGHLAADNGGKPKIVAEELKKFFGTNRKIKSTNR
ncbi:MAG: alpha/beta hydrolase [Saprospiraceae bacterium]